MAGFITEKRFKRPLPNVTKEVTRTGRFFLVIEITAFPGEIRVLQVKVKLKRTEYPTSYNII